MMSCGKCGDATEEEYRATAKAYQERSRPQPAPSAAEHNPNQYYKPPQMKARDEAFSTFCSQYGVPTWESDREGHNQQWRAFREGYAAAERRAKDAEAALRDWVAHVERFHGLEAYPGSRCAWCPNVENEARAALGRHDGRPA